MSDKEKLQAIKDEIERRIKNLSLILNIGNTEELTKEEEYGHCVEQETLKSLLIFINSFQEYPSPKFKIGNTIRDKEGKTGAFTITDIKVEDKSLVYLGNKRQKVSIWCQDDYEIVNNDLLVKEEPASEDLDRLVISLEETIGTSPHSREVIKEHLQKAAEWGINHFKDKNEIVSEDLEEAATKWNETASFQPFYMQLDCNGNPCEVKQDITTHKESFKAGVKWDKQQIIKDAVDGEYWDGSIYLDNRPTEYKDGDKVKIIIVKENENHIKEEPTC